MMTMRRAAWCVALALAPSVRENCLDRRGAHVEGVAEYGRFRQFQVNVDEQFLIKK